MEYKLNRFFVSAILACLFALPLAANAAAIPHWLKANKVEGIVDCKLSAENRLVVDYAEIRTRRETTGFELIGSSCSEALASLQRRRDLKVEEPLGLVPGRDALVFEVRGPQRPVATLIGCARRGEFLEVAWVDDPGAASGMVGESCMDVILSSRKRGFAVGLAAAQRLDAYRADAHGSASLVSTFGGSRGRPDRPATVIGCDLSDDDRLQLSFIDSSDEFLQRQPINPGDDCAATRRLLNETATLVASTPVSATLRDELGQPQHLVYSVHTRGVELPRDKVYSCDNFADSAPAGDLLVVSNRDGRVLRTQPVSCSLMGAEAGIDGRQYEVAVSAEFIRLAGGVDAILDGRSGSLNCGLCRELKREDGPANPPGNYWGQLTTPAVTESIGVIGYHPYGVTPMYGGPWHFGDWESTDSNPTTSWCAQGPVNWGLLTNSRGFEIEVTNGLVHWGNRAFIGYDATYGWMRSVNVHPTDHDYSGNIASKTKIYRAGRLDICGW